MYIFNLHDSHAESPITKHSTVKKIRKIDATLMIILMITLFFTGNFPVQAQEVTNKHPASVQLVTGYITGLYETDQPNITD